MKSAIKKGVAIGVIICTVAVLGLYLGRNTLLRYYADLEIRKAGQRYGLDITYKTLHFLGANTIELNELAIIPHSKDTLLKVRVLQTELDLWELLKRNIAVKQICSEDIAISFVKKSGLSNYDFIFKKEKVSQSEETKDNNFSTYASKIFNLLFGVLPKNRNIRNFSVSILRDSTFAEIKIPELKIVDHKFSSSLKVTEDNREEIWNIKGVLQSDNKTAEISLSGTSGRVSIPYIYRYYGARVSFESLSFMLTEKQFGTDKTSLLGKAEIAGLEIFHKRLSPEMINLDSGSFDYKINIGKNEIELDSATIIRFNQLDFNPYIYAEKKRKWHIAASLDKSWFPSQYLFSSLPKGLFENLEGFKTTGELSYHFLLDVDFNVLDSLKFESELKERNFRILEYGKTDLQKMNDEFLYTAYEHGEPVRSFLVGISNPDFTPIDSISPLLKMSLLQSEDGAFFYHRGFLIEAMREALIHDLKVKRFARGGSTITMQLVKNVFLNRNKNIARKLEEALIVWLIENEHLTSKQRMLEVYLNVIEWGPMVYGIKEASGFYFRKTPSQLSINEAIFLVSIIPNPKGFRFSFDENMKLKERLGYYYDLIGTRLKKKELISVDEIKNIRPDVQIKGEALHYLEGKKDSLK